MSRPMILAMNGWYPASQEECKKEIKILSMINCLLKAKIQFQQLFRMPAGFFAAIFLLIQ